MKKIQLLVLLPVMMMACNKSATDCATGAANYKPAARTVGEITFTGETAWLKFGTWGNTSGSWECTSSYNFCQYEYTGTEGHIPTSGEATGEIGSEEGVLYIALDKNSMTTHDKEVFYTRDGEFHLDASGYYTTSGFDIKNAADANQNTIGDIHVDHGVYPVYEDDNTILVVFEEVGE